MNLYGNEHKIRDECQQLAHVRDTALAVSEAEALAAWWEEMAVPALAQFSPFACYVCAYESSGADLSNAAGWRVIRNWISILLVMLLIAGLVLFVPLPGITIAFSGESFVAGDHQVIIGYCYSRWTERLLYAIVQTWPKEATVAEKMNDPRVGKTFYEWRTVRNNDGRMSPVSAGGWVYFFEGNVLKTVRVYMTESDDTASISDSQSLANVWACFERFRVK